MKSLFFKCKPFYQSNCLLMNMKFINGFHILAFLFILISFIHCNDHNDQVNNSKIHVDQVTRKLLMGSELIKDIKRRRQDKLISLEKQT